MYKSIYYIYRSRARKRCHRLRDFSARRLAVAVVDRSGTLFLRIFIFAISTGSEVHDRHKQKASLIYTAVSPKKRHFQALKHTSGQQKTFVVQSYFCSRKIAEYKLEDQCQAINLKFFIMTILSLLI